VRVALPIALCVVGGILVWRAQAARTDQQEARARVVALEQARDTARRKRDVAAVTRRLTAARAAEARESDRMSFHTWALGLLTLPAAGLLLIGRSPRRTDEQGDRSADRRLQALVQHSSDMITVLDASGVVLTQTGAAILGHEPGEMLRRRLAPLVHEDDATTLSRVLNGDVEGATVEWRLQHASGAWLHVESAVADMRDDPEIHGIVLTSRDVTERKASEAQLRHRAFHDPLTQLPNRALFYDRIEHALQRAAREGELVAVCVLDLDDFKGVNDTLGHAAGDELLIQVAHRLRGSLRTGDTAARLGGDEFGILLEGVGERSEPIQIADRLLALMGQPFDVADTELNVLPSVGVAITEGQDELVEDLLRHADVAMYAAKRNGKGRYEVYDAEPRQPRPPSPSRAATRSATTRRPSA
jgi:diguanylate cyclase (GGDEF)-like protein/PAS domain S-box-containing protein